jgi:hypothetical protein
VFIDEGYSTSISNIPDTSKKIVSTSSISLLPSLNSVFNFTPNFVYNGELSPE